MYNFLLLSEPPYLDNLFQDIKIEHKVENAGH
jgi:hypothetical protein